MTIRGSHIRAGAIAVSVSERGRVVIDDSTIEGGEAAIFLENLARVEVGTNRLDGGVESKGKAEYVDLGGNQPLSEDPE